MRRQVMLLLLPLLVPVTLAGQQADADTTHPAVEDTVARIAQEWTDAWNDLEAERLLPLHSEDLQYYYTCHRMSSRAEFEGILREYIIPEESYSVEMVEPHVRVLGSDAAVVWFRLRGEVHPTDEPSRPFAAAISLVMAQRGSEWRIVHVHENGELAREACEE